MNHPCTIRGYGVIGDLVSASRRRRVTPQGVVSDNRARGPSTATATGVVRGRRQTTRFSSHSGRKHAAGSRISAMPLSDCGRLVKRLMGRRDVSVCMRQGVCALHERRYHNWCTASNIQKSYYLGPQGKSLYPKIGDPVGRRSALQVISSGPCFSHPMFGRV